jgi:hypothetical protein
VGMGKASVILTEDSAMSLAERMVCSFCSMDPQLPGREVPLVSLSAFSLVAVETKIRFRGAFGRAKETIDNPHARRAP